MLQPSVPDALQALMVLAQQANPVTPSGQPTVAAQLAQASASQGMPQAVQDFEAAVPSVMRNMQQDQIQQMVRSAMKPQAAGIEGLPAPNMQFAEGGVIGFAGPEGSLVTGYDRDYNDARRFGISLSPYDAPAVRAEKLARVQRMREFEAQQEVGGRAEIPTEASVQADAVLKQAFGDQASRMRDVPPSSMPAPVPAGARPASTPRQTVRPTGTQARPTPAAQAPAAPVAVPPGGIAQALPPAPTLEQAMQQAEQALPGTGTANSRAALEELQRMRRERPESGVATLRALEEEGRTAAEINRELEESKRARGIERWLQGGARLGSSGRAVAGFEEGERQRRMLFAQQNTIRIGKMDAIKEANEARRVGDQEKYVEALNKLAELDRADKQIKAQLAGQVLTSGVTARGQDITAGTAAADREAAAARLERQIQAQAAEGKLDRDSRERIAAAAATAAKTRGGDPNTIYNTIIDNVQKEYDAWTKSVEGVRATPQQQAAKRQEIIDRQVRIASSVGVTGLEGLLAGQRQTPPPTASRVVDFSSIK